MDSDNILSQNPQKQIESLITSIYTEKENPKLIKARTILGNNPDISDEQLETFIVQFEHLVGCWLDVFEKNLFRGKTLKELLKLT